MSPWIEMCFIGITHVWREKCLPCCICGNLLRTIAQFLAYAAKGAATPGLVILGHGFKLTFKRRGNNRYTVCLPMRMMLCLTDGLAAILKNHHSGVARGEITIEVAPQARDGIDFVDRELRKSALVFTTINNHVRFANGRL